MVMQPKSAEEISDDFYEDDDGYIGWTLTLYAVPNGNMNSDEISEGEFPSF